ncbi:MAG TPA: OB-fold nucleic acid binding domain-containing protein, partial [Segeticoccus sp.]|nr:OB-fold nucleic acid binding domain-containing protein [Segeticoccus sp.]
AALLTSVRDDKDKSALYLNECRHMGIKVLPPSVNESVANFAAVGADIRFGLAAIRNVGRNVVDAIIGAREEKGKFTSFEDFLRKCPAVVCNKRTIESLIKAGAFDDLDHTRQGLVHVHEAYVDALVDEKRQEAIGQDSLFSGLGGFGGGEEAADDASGGSLIAMPTIPSIEWDKQTLLAFEREMLGLYVSDHPLFGIEHVLAQHADTSIASLMAEDGKPDGANVTIAGLITGLQIKRTKKGDLWAIATVEDLDGAIECLFFPSTYMTVSTMLGHDVVCAVKGRVSRRDDNPSVFASELTLPDIKEGPRGPVVVSMPLARATNGLAERLRGVLGDHPGVTEVQVKLVQPGRSVLMKLDDSLRVTASPALFGDLKALLGPSCVSG